jgi:hypothetical protein
MIKNSESLTFEIKHLSGELRRLEQRLRTEPEPDPMALNEFRQAVDNARLTAWSVSELLNAQHIRKEPNTVLAFLSAERLRRFDQLVKNVCGDIERGLITVETTGMQSLGESVDNLQQRLTQCFRERSRLQGSCDVNMSSTAARKY